MPTPTTDSQYDRHKPYAQGGMPLALAVKLLPTPIANDAANQTCSPSRLGKAKAPGLMATLTRLLPAPVASEAGQGNLSNPKRGRKLTTAVTARLLPTPTASMHTAQDMEQARYNPKARPDYQAGGPLLNPRFVLEMMGFPPNWCDLTEAEMQQVRREIRAAKKLARQRLPPSLSQPASGPAIGPEIPSKPLATP